MSAYWLRIDAQKGEKLRKSGTSVCSGHSQSANMLSEIPKSVNQIVDHPNVAVYFANSPRELDRVKLPYPVEGY